jgi:deazaflavin-dependent oxidoreductase (nitroreductase family)
VAEGKTGNTFFEKVATPIAASKPGAWFYVNVAPAIDRRLMRWTNGRLTTGGFGRVGMLNVRGAKTGEMRHTPLVYTRDGESVVVVASRGGDVKHPAWYRNVVANPDVTFTRDGDERPYHARTVSGEEREQLWKAVNRTYAGYAAYQARAGEREIPVVVLEPSNNQPEGSPRP